MIKILGISAYYHDSAAALIIDGKIIAAAQEERFTRIKHDYSYPYNSIKYILNSNNLTLNEIDKIIFYEKPFIKFERILENYIAFSPRGFLQFSKSMPIWLKEKLFLKRELIKNLKQHDKNTNNIKDKIYFSDHHLSHAASAFYPSPFDKSLIFVADAVGENTTTSLAIGDNNSIKIVQEINYPHSLGLIYSSFTYYCGFKVNSGEYKLMGLSPYGKPKYIKLIKENLIDIKDDGSFRLNMDFFEYQTGFKMINERFERLFGMKTRKPETNSIDQFYMDIASSIQNVLEEIIIKCLKYAKQKYQLENLCLAGGVALNCVANGKIQKEKIFKNIWIQPASGDAGGALGSALALWYLDKNNKRTIYANDSMNGSYLGPSFSNEEIQQKLNDLNAKFHLLDENDLINETTNALIKGKVIGWFQGRAEFGPRALGNRSILGDPRSSTMQRDLNLKIKFRENFRPFAPAILEEHMKEWFDLDIESPYMLYVSKLIQNRQLKVDESGNLGLEKLKFLRSEIPAVTHVDYTARIQTISKKTNEKFYNLVNNFFKKTNCPMLVNTSFNIRGEPIVGSPDDAYRCLMGTNLDILVIGNYLLIKSEQIKSNQINYKDKYGLD